jgi:aspartate aminotransferase
MMQDPDLRAIRGFAERQIMLNCFSRRTPQLVPMFEKLPDYENDPIEAMFVRLAGDRDAAKMDLGIGVYRDENGVAPVMEAVRLAEQQILNRRLPKSYLSPLGNADYCRDMEKLVLGDSHRLIDECRIVSAQTPGAGSALRAGAELVHRISPQADVWVSEPVWAHQLEFFTEAGIGIRRYRYYDQGSCRQQFAEMQEDLRRMCRGDLLLLHGCCHNPSGQDLSPEQWQVIAELVVEKGAIPFVDIAYQGFGAGIEEDVAGFRLFADRVPQMLLTVSSSKTFGIYRERAGLLSVVLPPGAAVFRNVQQRLRDIVRQLYFMAPDHGAAIVHEILATTELTALWRAELDAIRLHVARMRAALKETIERRIPQFDASFLVRQHGMFSCLPITFGEQLFLEREFHIYMLPPARVNVAAMNSSQAARLAEAFNTVLERRLAGQKTA